MPAIPPPDGASSSPVATTLPAGSALWRVHRRSRYANTFKKVRADQTFGGGRFDSTDNDPYAFLYAAADQHTAVLETVVRSKPFDESGWRRIRRASLMERRLSPLVTTRALTLVSLLTTEDLAAVRQDEWLVQAEPDAYPQTRRWAHWLRSQADWAEGFVWPSRRNLGRQVFVLFGDRCQDAALSEGPHEPIDLDDTAGADWLNVHLAPYRVHVSHPPPR